MRWKPFHRKSGYINMLQRILAVLSVVSLAMLSACAKPIARTPHISQQELRAEQQKQMKLATEAKLKKQQIVMKKRVEAEQRILRVAPSILKAGAELCGVLIPADEPCLYDVRVDENQKQINAFADGKNIIVTQAMMNFIESDEELAVILGHELAHNMMQHIDAQKTNLVTGALLGSVLDAVAKSQGVNTGSGFSKMGTQVGALRYSKAFEAEADYVGLYITARAGFNINNAAHFWRRMSVRNPDAIYIASTHPSNPERFIALSKTEGEIKYKQKQGMALVPDTKTQKSEIQHVSY